MALPALQTRVPGRLDATQQPLRSTLCARGVLSHCLQQAPNKPGIHPRQVQQLDPQQRQRGNLQVNVNTGAGGYSYAPTFSPEPDDTSSVRLKEAARRSLARATSAMKRFGWLGFWSQLALSTVSGVILLFSVAFTSQNGPRASLYLTLVGILAGFLSVFWNYGYLRTAQQLQEYLDGADVAKITKQQVIEMIKRGLVINVTGLGATLIGIQTLVGMLVAKTLTNASVNPFMASAAGSYNPVLALDVFLVQAATNTLFGHFLSLLFSLWLLNVMIDGRGRRFQRAMRIKRFKDAQAASSGGFRTLSGAIIERTAGTVRGQAGVYELAKAGSLMRRAGTSSAGGVPPLSSSIGGVRPSSAGAAPPLSSSVGGVRPSSALSAVAASSLNGAGSAAARRVVARATGTSAAMALPQLARVPSPAANEFLLLPDTQSLANLDGSLPGYAAFDPLGLYNSEYEGTLLDPRWLALAEIMHGRWAMLGVTGCLAPEMGAVLSNGGHRAASAEWFRSGFLPPVALPRSEAMLGPHYWADPGQLFVLQVVVMALAEGARLADYASPGSFGQGLRRAGLPLHVAEAFDGSSDPVNRAYPGGQLFNPAPLVESPAAMSQLALAEMKHGRLAMLAMMGLGAQAVLTGAGPVFNLADHLRSPLGANIFSNLAAVP